MEPLTQAQCVRRVNGKSGARASIGVWWNHRQKLNIIILFVSRELITNNFKLRAVLKNSTCQKETRVLLDTAEKFSSKNVKTTEFSQMERVQTHK